jgi:hypothetical protein
MPMHMKVYTHTCVCIHVHIYVSTDDDDDDVYLIKITTCGYKIYLHTNTESGRKAKVQDGIKS